jgi:hypothetical protein
VVLDWIGYDHSLHWGGAEIVIRDWNTVKMKEFAVVSEMCVG